LKSLSKAFYIFSPDDAGKVAHVNYLPKEVLDSKVLDAKTWLGEVSKVIGGKVGWGNCIGRSVELTSRAEESRTALAVLEARLRRFRRLWRSRRRSTRTRSRVLNVMREVALYTHRMRWNISAGAGSQRGTAHLFSREMVLLMNASAKALNLTSVGTASEGATRRSYSKV